jgi:hypothetical protein
MAGSFKRKNTERFKWDDAKSVAAAWEAAARWDGNFKLPPSFVATVPALPAAGRMAIADASAVFMSLREGEKIAAATLRKYRTFTKQLLAFAESRGYVMLDQLTSGTWICSTVVFVLFGSPNQQPVQGPLGRLTLITRPDNGTTAFKYTDTPGSVNVLTQTDQRSSPKPKRNGYGWSRSNLSSWSLTTTAWRAIELRSGGSSHSNEDLYDNRLDDASGVRAIRSGCAGLR